ncbi:hypothetical protein ABT104_32185 [Streptomyces mobaraensis]|uniref:hypothetical protein n=1 Tax=Streptomyces mobaraensis TaxID=35621 RepID=UPI003328569B
MTAPVERVDLGRLTKGALLGRGGQGSVWAIRGGKVAGAWPMAYKEYSPESRARLDADALERMVAFVGELPAPAGRLLCEHTAWPAALVTDGPRVTGFLMRQVPDRFFVDLGPAPAERRIAGLEYLLNPPEYLARVGLRVDGRQRLELLRHLARTLDRLHGVGAAVGDLSPKNVLFALGTEPECFLIDCDAARLAGRSPLPQAETVEWGLPAGEELGTPAGDAYKFGLLAMRLAAGAQDGRDSGPLRALAPDLDVLAERSQSPDPAARPTLATWVRALEPAVLAAGRRTGTTGRTAAASASPSASSSARPTPAPLPAASGGKRGAGGAFVVVLLIALGLYLANQDFDGASDYEDVPASGSTTLTTALPSPADPSPTPDTSRDVTEQDQARALDRLLRRNLGVRENVAALVDAVQRCTNDSEVVLAGEGLDRAAEERSARLDELNSLDIGRLPSSAELAENLRRALSASAEADRAYARWAAARSAAGCSAGGDDLARAQSASERATAAKQEFVRLWRLVGERYGLPTYNWDDL